jgi:hypothetical protein
VPLPKQHLDRLKKELTGHDRRASELKESLLLQQEEVRVHETVVRLGRDTKLLAALGELHDDPLLAGKIQGDPLKHFESKGVALPQGAEVVVADASPGSTRVEARLTQGPYRYKVSWARAKGFTLENAADGPRSG